MFGFWYFPSPLQWESHQGLYKMDAFCGKWRLDRDGCEGEREFYEAEGSIPDQEMLDKILEAECIISMAEVAGII